MKQPLLAIIGVALILLPQVSSAALVDVQNTRYRQAFEYFERKAVIQGYPDGTGRPYSSISRAEALKIIVAMRPLTAERASKYAARPPSSIPLFKDVPPGAWFSAPVEVGFEFGILNGYPDRTFRPGNQVKTEEAVVMLMRAFGLHAQGGGSEGWYSEDVKTALQKNIVASAENVHLGDALTRGQFLDMAYRLSEVQDRRLTSFDDPAAASPRQTLIRREPAPAPAPGAVGAPFSISIPRLGISNLRVSHPANAFTSKGLLAVLKDGVGHLFGYPGGGAPIMIFGHSSDFPWNVSNYSKIFARVNELKPGDKVHVNYNGAQYTYSVSYQQIISPTDSKPFKGPGEKLVLYTCWPVGSAKTRLIVVANPDGRVVQQ